MKSKEYAKKELSVALLMSDVVKARELSKVFRKTGVIPFVYQDLKQFWDDVYAQKPALSVVDVSMMSQGKLLFKDHPLVKSSQLKLSFFYSPENIPLLYSTFELDHLGTISSEVSLKGQVKNILKRFNYLSETEENLNRLKKEESRLEGHVTGLLRQLEGFKEREYFSKLTDSMIARFEAVQQSNTFDEIIDRVLSSFHEVKSFSMFELSKNGQKLISPELTSRKFKSLPPIWLGRTSNQGIESFAQTMAQQVAAEVMSGELMALSIRGEGENPDKLILLKLEEENLLNVIDWDRFELYLSGLYARYLIGERELEYDVSSEVSPWLMMALLDRIYLDGKAVAISEESTAQSSEFGEATSSYAVISLDFSALINFIRSRQLKTRFYWNEFYREFFKRFELQYKSHFRMASFGVSKNLLLVEREHADKIFYQLKSFIGRYPLWRYFEDVDIVLATDLRPEVVMVPPTSLAILNYMQTGPFQTSRKEIKTHAQIEEIEQDQVASEESSREMLESGKSQFDDLEDQVIDNISNELEFDFDQKALQIKNTRSEVRRHRKDIGLSLDI